MFQERLLPTEAVLFLLQPHKAVSETVPSDTPLPAHTLSDWKAQNRDCFIRLQPIFWSLEPVGCWGEAVFFAVPWIYTAERKTGEQSFPPPLLRRLGSGEQWSSQSTWILKPETLHKGWEGNSWKLSVKMLTPGMVEARWPCICIAPVEESFSYALQINTSLLQ